MKARISGRAAAFAVKVADGWELRRRGRTERVKVEEMDVTRALGGTPDVIEIDAKSVIEVERRLETEWSKHRALRLTIMLLDPTERVEGLDDVAAMLETLLTNRYVVEFIESQFCQQELPPESKIERSVTIAADHPLLAAMLGRIQDWQTAVQQVCVSFDTLDPKLFGGEDEKAEYREAAIASGAFRSLVKSTTEGALSDAAIFELHGHLRKLGNNRAVVPEWTSAFQRVAVERPVLPPDLAEDFEDDVADFGGGPGGYQRLQNALEQQHAILARVATGDYDNARKFARELAQQQLASNDRHYLAKSFTRLSQGAREMEAFELDLEWSHEAVGCNTDDARAHTQYADALLQAGRYDDALEQFHRAGALGEQGYAATGYARTMRHLGRFDEALEAYDAAIREHRGTEHEIYALVGTSNVMADRGDIESAVAHASEVVGRFPGEHVARLNLATLLTRRARFQEAWHEFLEAEKLCSDKAPVFSGLAEICRRTGRLEEARRRFADMAQNYPRNVRARIGLIDTLRSLGEYNQAAIYARRTWELFPGSVRAAGRYAEISSLLGRHASARQILAKATAKFPKDSWLPLVRITAYRRQGRYHRALAAVEDATAKFPYSRRLSLLRAEMLRRLGKIAAAREHYRRLMEADQADMKARNGLASLLILDNQAELAERLIDNDDPRTEDEWRSFLLKATLAERRGEIGEARERIQWAVENCPFFTERRLFVAAAAKLAAKSRNARKAPHIPILPERDICNLISFQIAAITKSHHAVKAYTALSRNLPERYEVLCDEIARNYGISKQKPRHSTAWIARRLNDEFLLAAA